MITPLRASFLVPSKVGGALGGAGNLSVNLLLPLRLYGSLRGQGGLESDLVVIPTVEGWIRGTGVLGTRIICFCEVDAFLSTPVNTRTGNTLPFLERGKRLLEGSRGMVLGGRGSQGSVAERITHHAGRT